MYIYDSTIVIPFPAIACAAFSKRMSYIKREDLIDYWKDEHDQGKSTNY